MTNWMSDCWLTADWLMTDCWLTADWLLTDCWLIAWRFELKRWRLTALDKFEPNERTNIVTPRAPVGAKKKQLKEF